MVARRIIFAGQGDKACSLWHNFRQGRETAGSGVYGQLQGFGARVKNYYSDLDKRAFWKSGVVAPSHLAVPDIYRKKWEIGPDQKIGTAGSCFAQHIARHLTQNGYRVLDVEPAPRGLPEAQHAAFGYGMYSARYGNLYSARQLRQLVEAAFSDDPGPFLIWEREGRFFDAFRPTIEPNGFLSRDEVIEARRYHLRCVRRLFLEVDVFVFTLGLTEAWVHKESGQVVPLAPGIVAGEDRAQDYEFVNFSYGAIEADFRAVMQMLDDLRGRKRPLRYLLTVSPVPLTATASGQHVLAAATYSKSVLRAVAGWLCETCNNVDYFPSYEIITNPAARGTFFESNLRSVMTEGVEVVMNAFFAAHPPRLRKEETGPRPTEVPANEDVQCDEQMLEAFGR